MNDDVTTKSYILRSEEHGAWRLLWYGETAGGLPGFLRGWEGPGWYLRAESDRTRQFILPATATHEQAMIVALGLIRQGRMHPVDGRGDAGG